MLIVALRTYEPWTAATVLGGVVLAACLPGAVQRWGSKCKGLRPKTKGPPLQVCNLSGHNNLLLVGNKLGPLLTIWRIPFKRICKEG